LICPHCKFESFESPCAACGWEWSRSCVWAAEESERAGFSERALRYWREAVRLAPTDARVKRSFVIHLNRYAMASYSEAAFDDAAASWESVLSLDQDWAEGHQMRVLLYGRYGRLDELLLLYESMGALGSRWAENVRLVRRFSEEGVPNPGDAGLVFKRAWWIRPFFLVAGLLLTGLSSTWCKYAIEKQTTLFFPVFLMVFGLALSAGSALLDWKERKKKERTGPFKHELH
jgi:tetratricopeptide (TPR) repeat protein